MVHVGFTGSQKGMTESQKLELWHALALYEPAGWFHHGDCIGADREARDIAKELGWRIYQHPPTDSKKRAFCFDNVENTPKPYLERNKDIVNASTIVYAAPNQAQEKLRSGTWATIRYAIMVGKRLVIFKP